MSAPYQYEAFEVSGIILALKLAKLDLICHFFQFLRKMAAGVTSKLKISAFLAEIFETKVILRLLKLFRVDLAQKTKKKISTLTPSL